MLKIFIGNTFRPMACNCKKNKTASSVKSATRTYSVNNKGMRKSTNGGKRIIRRTIK